MTYRLLAALPLLLLLLPTCTDNFEELNTNENAPSRVEPELLLRQVLYGYGDDMSYEGFVAGNLLSQHFAMIDFNLFDRHALSSPQEGGNPWDILYQNLRDTETILEEARSNPARQVYEGPALVLKAYLAMTLTDLFGDVPFFTAFRGRSAGLVTPAYDAQEDIYLAQGGILDLLETAVTVMEADGGTQPLRGDILFNGDLAGYIRFANSLRIKALLRISGRQDVAAQLQALYDAGNYIRESEQNATFDFTDGPPNSFAFATARIGIFNVFLMSETADSILNRYEHPLQSVLYRPSENAFRFRGIRNGIDASSAIVPDDFSRPGPIFREQTGRLDFNYLTAWETNFLLAEAALRGYITAEPAPLFLEALRQSVGYWGEAGSDEDYLNLRLEAFEAASPADRLRDVISLKWVASIGNGYEGWTEWRRTGYPELLPVAASLNEGRYPVRMPYPADEQALNAENYSQAAGATDGNSINVPVWWDVD